jgi:hypothetical protein
MRSESLRVAGPTPELFRYIRRNQLDLGTVAAHAGYLNVALVKFLMDDDGAEAFVFGPDGQPAAIIEALLFDDMREEFTADLVAWPVGSPELFATAMGLEDGASLLGPQNMVQRQGAPLVVHRTPLAWLKAGCAGCVPLKPAAGQWLHLAGGPFAVEDIDHGYDLRDLLGPNALKHTILVPKKERAA